MQMREVACRNTLEYHTIQLLLIIQAGEELEACFIRMTFGENIH